MAVLLTSLTNRPTVQSPVPRRRSLSKRPTTGSSSDPAGPRVCWRVAARAGLAAEVASWSDKIAPVPLSGAGSAKPFTSRPLAPSPRRPASIPILSRTILGYALPEIIMLAKSGAVPPEIPVLNADEPAVPLSPTPAEPFSPETQRPCKRATGYSFPLPHQGRRRVSKNSPLQVRCWRLLFGFGLGGLAFFRGSRIAGERRADRDAHGRGHNGPQSQRRGLRAAQSQSQTDATTLADLKSRLDAAKTETAAIDRRCCGEGRAATGFGDESLATFRAAGSPRTSDRGHRCAAPAAPPRCKAPRAPGSRRKWPPRCQDRQPSTPPKIPAAQDRAETGRN